MIISDDDLDNMEHIAKRATPGPWSAVEPPKTVEGFPIGLIIASVGRGRHIYAVPKDADGFDEQTSANRWHIAEASPSVVLAMIAEIRALRAKARKGHR